MSFLMARSSLSVTNGTSYFPAWAGVTSADTRLASFRAPEALFQPAFLGLEAAGIHETT